MKPGKLRLQPIFTISLICGSSKCKANGYCFYNFCVISYIITLNVSCAFYRCYSETITIKES
jgi:hypothetical protein